MSLLCVCCVSIVCLWCADDKKIRMRGSLVVTVRGEQVLLQIKRTQRCFTTTQHIHEGLCVSNLLFIQANTLYFGNN